MIKNKVCVIADQDARASWSYSLALALVQRNFSVNVRLSREIFDIYDKSFIAESIKPFYILHEVIDDDLMSMDVVIFGLGGGSNIKFLELLKQRIDVNGATRRPVIVTGFAGVQDPTNPHGLLCRIGSDIICVNSDIDYNTYCQTLVSMGIDHSPLKITGFIQGLPIYALRSPVITIKNVIYIEQLGLLNDKAKRDYIIDQLYSYSKKFPERSLTIKLRSRMGSKLFGWKARSSFERQFYQRVGRLPININFSDSAIEEVLPKSDLVISFSSTAIVEAIILKKKIAIIRDLGIDARFGNQVFINSGLLTSFKDILQDKISEPNAKWVDRFICFDQEAVKRVIEHIIQLILKQSSISSPLQFKSVEYSIEEYQFLHRYKSFVNESTIERVKKIITKLIGNFFI